MTSERTIQKKDSNRKQIVQALLSAWIVFHLLAVVIMPNKNTYLGYLFARWLEPYANSLELASNWNFFAPEPGMPMRLEFETVDSKGDQLVHDFWPTLRSPWRKIALSHFIMKGPPGGEALFGKFLCGKNPAASSVRMWKNSYGLPDLMEVADGKKNIKDEILVERQWISEWNCEDRSTL